MLKRLGALLQRAEKMKQLYVMRPIVNLNPLTPVSVVTSRAECWPFFHF